tara:strand:+ start:322 stop:483 length:162 start_codon:yes stop_codon:yes gene_type:complete
MGSLRATLRAATLENIYKVYINLIVLTGYTKADLGKEITRSFKKSATLWWVCK